MLNLTYTYSINMALWLDIDILFSDIPYYSGVSIPICFAALPVCDPCASVSTLIVLLLCPVNLPLYSVFKSECLALLK